VPFRLFRSFFDPKLRDASHVYGMLESGHKLLHPHYLTGVRNLQNYCNPATE
jgi:hypothetical protein